MTESITIIITIITILVIIKMFSDIMLTKIKASKWDKTLQIATF